MKKKLILTLCALTSLVACQKEEVTGQQGDVINPITFTVDNNATRVNGSNFEQGDEISVFAYNADGSQYGTAYYQYDGTQNKFTPSSLALGYTSADQELKFVASYPATNSASYTFSMQSAQNSGDNYEKSDLLVASTSATGKSEIALSFNHVLSNVVVNITGASYSNVLLNAKIAAACNLKSGSYAASGSSVEFSPAANSSQGIKAIVAPQTLASGAKFITATVNGAEVTANMTTSLTLKSEARYVLDWNLTTGKVTMDGKVIAEKGSSTSTDEPVNTKYGNLPVLPAERTDKKGDYHYAYHSCDGKLNFAACYSEEYTCPVWVAGAYHKWYVNGTGDRTNAYKDDPDIPCYQVESLKGSYNRGHMIASSERLKSDAMNRQVFYLSNIAPQLIDHFNSGGGVWNNYEDWMKGVYMSRNDTLFVVNGCHWDNTAKWVSGTRVPSHYYKACLRLKKANSTTAVKTASRDELECVAFYFKHQSSTSKPSRSHMISIDELEKLTGENFFANVKNAPEDTFNASDWGL